MALFEGLVFQISLPCPKCLQPVHVQGMTKTAWCGACNHDVPLPVATWAGWFGPSEIAEALGLPDGEARQITSLGSGAKYAYGHRMPRCQSCKATPAVEDLPRFAADGGYSCACGQRIRVRPATELAGALVPGARFLVNEGATKAESGAGDAPGPAVEPVMFACMACGAALKVDGRDRTVTCEFCSGTSFLPDALWLRLHPARTVQPFFVVLESGGRSAISPALLARLAQDGDSDARSIAAANPDLPAEDLIRLATDDDDDVRAAVARNPATLPEQLALLVADDAYGVRAVAVTRAEVPTEALADRMRTESDSDVLRALGSRAAPLPAAVLVALAENQDDDAALVAATAPGTPEAVLVVLAGRPESQLHQALLARPHLPGAVARALGANEAVSDERRARARENPEWAAGRRTSQIRWAIAGAVLLALLTCVGGVTAVIGGGVVAARELLVPHAAHGRH